MVELVKNMDGVDKVEKKSFVVTSEKLEVKGKNQFVYSTNLDNVDALVESGEYSLNDDGTLSIYGDRNFYLKDKFVCTDAECNKDITNTIIFFFIFNQPLLTCYYITSILNLQAFSHLKFTNFPLNLA